MNFGDEKIFKVMSSKVKVTETFAGGGIPINGLPSKTIFSLLCFLSFLFCLSFAPKHSKSCHTYFSANIASNFTNLAYVTVWAARDTAVASGCF